MPALEEARRAYENHDWIGTFEVLSAFEPESLGPADLTALAEAAWWVGELDVCIAARKRLYEVFEAAGDQDAAAMQALGVSLRLGDKGEDALASSWRARAYRLAEKDPTSRTFGYLLSLEADEAFHAGRQDECIEKSRAAIEIGRTQNDPTLVAWATHVEGLGLLARGDVVQGWSRLNESMIETDPRRIDPIWGGMMHCGMLLACEMHEDSRRGWQWVVNTERWLAGLRGARLFPGVCRIHKVHFMQLNGAWREAEAEARIACEDLLTIHVYTAGRGFYEIAEIMRLRGDLSEAQQLYEKAHELGFDPQPGLAQLRLAQGRIDAAAAGIRRVLETATDQATIAHLLPHKIEIDLAGGRTEDAREGLDRLCALAERYGSPGMSGSAATWAGAVALADGDATGAAGHLRRALDMWLAIDRPYEVARARVLLSAAMSRLGDVDGARLELQAARQVYERLGARRDLERVDRELGGAQHPGGLSDREVEVLRLIAQGRSNKQIAATLVISENTVARHISNIFTKLGVESRAGAATFAHSSGILA